MHMNSNYIDQIKCICNGNQKWCLGHKKQFEINEEQAGNGVSYEKLKKCWEWEGVNLYFKIKAVNATEWTQREQGHKDLSREKPFG